MVAVGPTTQTHFLFTVVRKSDMIADTLDVLLKAFAWSVNVLLSGETPSVTWLNVCIDGGGEVLAGGWRGAMHLFRGDWQ